MADDTGGTFHHRDVSVEEGWRRGVEATVAGHGRIDVLVNNASIFHRAKLVDHTLDDLRRLIDTNLIGVFLGMPAVAPTMIDQEAGSIVNISSIAGRVNSIRPGMIDTEMMVEVTSGDQRRHARMEASLPIRRAAAADEIANLALYLVADGGVTAQ